MCHREHGELGLHPEGLFERLVPSAGIAFRSCCAFQLGPLGLRRSPWGRYDEVQRHHEVQGVPSV